MPLPHHIFKMEITVSSSWGCLRIKRDAIYNSSWLSGCCFPALPEPVVPVWKSLEEPQDGAWGALWSRANSPWAAAMVEPTRAG